MTDHLPGESWEESDEDGLWLVTQLERARSRVLIEPSAAYVARIASEQVAAASQLPRAGATPRLTAPGLTYVVPKP